MKRISPFVLPLAAWLALASCTDSHYDLSDLDTHSRFHVSGLTLPLNMDPVKLDLMLDIDDDSDIKTDSEGHYFFRKEGSFSSKPVHVKKIVLSKPLVDINGKVSVNISLPADTKSKMQQYAQDISIGELLSNQTLMNLIGIHADTEILNIDFDSSTAATSEISLNASGIDENVRSIESLGIDPATLLINVKVNGIQNTLKPFAIHDLVLNMPKGFDAIPKEGTTYEAERGTLIPDNGTYWLGEDYVADLSLCVMGINYDQLEEEGMKIFDPANHTFKYKKQCAASGQAVLKISDLKSTAKYADIAALEQPDAVTYECHIGFSKDITIHSFKGKVTYSLDDIHVDPVHLSSVPEMLKENGTNIDLQNPQLYLRVNNHLDEYGIRVNSALEIKGNNTITAPLEIKNTEWTNLVMAPLNENLYHPTGYEYEKVEGLSGVVGSKNDFETFPSLLYIRAIKPEVPETSLTQPLELGKDLEGVEGTWEFYTKLSLTDQTKIKYTKEWDDWGDEDLDGLTINKATLNVTLQKDIAMDAESLEFILLGKKGKLSGQTSLKGGASQNITIDLTGDPVSEIQGAKLNVHLKGLNKDLNKEQEIRISNLKLTVDGYYDREL